MISERNIKIIGERLRTGREAQGRSLDDIANATRINLQFLEQLESGTGPKLPITYIDAFIKDYAREIGLNIDEFLEKTDESRKDSAPSPAVVQTVKAPPVEYKPPQPQFMFSLPHHIRLLLIVIAVVAVGLITTLFLIGNGESPEAPSEISFTDAVNQEEAKLLKTATVADSAARTDSLIFEGTARETVWVRVIIDGKDTSEAIYPPSAMRRWIAAESLQVYLGNAQAITFRLNGKDIGALSQTRRPLRNLVISRGTLDRLLKQSGER